MSEIFAHFKAITSAFYYKVVLHILGIGQILALTIAVKEYNAAQV